MNLFYAKSKDGETLDFYNKKELAEYLKDKKGKQLLVRINRTTGERTDDQNRALHKYFELVAKALNDGGFSVQVVLKQKMELDWTKDMVKELLWRTAQLAITGKKSTTKLDKVSEIDTIYEHLNRHLSGKFGVHIPFPHDPTKPKSYPHI